MEYPRRLMGVGRADEKKCGYKEVLVVESMMKATMKGIPVVWSFVKNGRRDSLRSCGSLRRVQRTGEEN